MIVKFLRHPFACQFSEHVKYSFAIDLTCLKCSKNQKFIPSHLQHLV